MRVRMKQVEKARWGFLILYLHCTACRKTTPHNEFHVGQFTCLYCEAINAMPPEQATAYQRAWEEKRQRAANEEAT
jgi:hypothetical protein